MTKKIIYITFLFVFGSIYSQSKLKKADKLYEAYAFSEATIIYEDFITKNENNIDKETLIKTANAFYFINDMRKAATYYEKAYNISSLQQPYLSKYVWSLRGIREYEKADTVYLKYLESLGDAAAINRFKQDVEIFNELLHTEEESRFTIFNLETNTPYSDFGAVFYNDQVVFSSARPAQGIIKDIYSWNEQPYLSLFVAERTPHGELANIELFSKQITSNFHDATFSFSSDNESVYYTSSNVNKKRLVLDNFSKNNFKVYRAKLIDGELSNIEDLFFNSDGYSVGHPHVTSDNKYLFFASDMPGGYGGADIYYCEIYEDGMISTPKNAGANVNTLGNDYFPFFIDNKLYFSSSGHLGFGGLDIYESDFSKETGFSKPVNLGKVVNTPYDDFSIVFHKDEKNGYFSSNRPGGKGDDDIYAFFRKPLPCDQFVTGTVIDKKSKEALSEVSIVVKDSLNYTIQEVKTDADGKYEVKIPCNQKVMITASKEEYVDKSQEQTIGDVDGEYTTPLNFELDKLSDLIVKDESGLEKINLDPIYFDYDKWDITPQAATALDKAVEVMSIFPKMVIKIEAHTDSRGTDSYNLSLSDKRAKATQEYLYSKGLEADRIVSAIGYGESRLLNHCSNGVKCSNEEHDINRRSDFIILEK